MNGSNPIFPLIGIGQATSVQAGQASENGNTAFAEDLTAALAGLSLTTVTLVQQKSETPGASFQGELIKAPLDAATLANDQAALENGVQGTGVFRPVGHADADLVAGSAGSAGIVPTGSADISANAAPSASTMVPDSGPQANGLHTADVEHIAKSPASLVDVDKAPAGVAGPSPAPSTAAKIDKPGQPEVRHPEPVSIQAAAIRPSGDVELDQPVANVGDRPLAASPINFADRSPQIVPAGREMVTMDNTPHAATPTLEEKVANIGAGVRNMPLAEVSLADAPLVGETRSVLPVSTVLADDQRRPIPSPLSSPGYQTDAHRMSVLSQQSLPGQPVIKKPAGAEIGSSLQHEVSNLAASHGESVLPARRRSVGAHGGDANHMTRPHVPEAGLNGRPEGRHVADRQGAPSVIVNQAVVNNSAPGAFPDSAAQTAAVDGGFRSIVEFGGFDRLQSVLPVEGPSLDGMRYEAASNLGQSKAQAPLTHVPAGAQIALQIVRSLPEGVDRFSVHLQPAELGRVDIQLDFEGGGRLSALITAERPETLELLQRDSRLLERSLGDSGLKLASDGLSFALKQDQQQQQQGQGFQEQAQARQAAVRAGRAYDDTLDTEQVPSARRVDGLRLLDIKT